MGKARPASSPFSLISLLEQSSSFSLPETESGTEGQQVTGTMRLLSGQIKHREAFEEKQQLSCLFLRPRSAEIISVPVQDQHEEPRLVCLT